MVDMAANLLSSECEEIQTRRSRGRRRPRITGPVSVLFILPQAIRSLCVSSSVLRKSSASQLRMFNFGKDGGDGSKSCTYVVDGGELSTILGKERSIPAAQVRATVGLTTEDGRRVVGVGNPSPTAAGGGTVELRGGIFLPADSTASVPDGMSDDDALSTAVASVAVHAMAFGDCMGTREGEDAGMRPEAIKRSVVMGGDSYACFVAQALGALGVQVTRVSTMGGNSDMEGVELIPPAVGELEVDFSSYVGKFDLLVDTIGDERTIEARGSENPLEIRQCRLFSDLKVSSSRNFEKSSIARDT